MEATIEEILTEAFADGKMTKKELKQGLKKFEEAHGKIPSDIKDVIWAMFDLLDANGDKVVTIEEVEAAMKQYSWTWLTSPVTYAAASAAGISR